MKKNLFSVLMKFSHLFMFSSFVFLALVLVPRFILGGWIHILFIPLVLSLVFFLLAVSLRFKTYINFFFHKNTKNGLNTGALILLFLACILSVNYFASRYNFHWDFSEGKMNSLSQKSHKALEYFKKDLSFKVFYRIQQDDLLKTKVLTALQVYKNSHPNVNIEAIDVYKDQLKSQKYLKNMSQIKGFGVFVEYEGKKIIISKPYTENEITSALIQLQKSAHKTVWFLEGHGERDIKSSDLGGIKFFKESLKDLSYQSKSINLFETQKMPPEKDILAIIGPKTNFSVSEIKQIINWLKKGGSLFLAIDPGKRHSLKNLVSQLGVNFKNNYVLNHSIPSLRSRGLTAVIGYLFHPVNPITSAFRFEKGFSFFDGVSQVELKEDNQYSELKRDILVSTPAQGFIAANSLADIKDKKKSFSYAKYPLAVSVEGKLKKGKKVFRAVIFGDSDFLTQKDIIQGFNKDFSLNAISYLAKEENLASISPKSIKRTKINLTPVYQNSLVLFQVSIPLIFFILSGFFYFRRKRL